MADIGYNGITSDISECNVGDTVHISIIQCIGYPCPYYFGSGENFQIYEDGILIDTILGRTFQSDGYDYVPSVSGEHIITLSQSHITGYDTSNPLTITVSSPISSPPNLKQHFLTYDSVELVTLNVTYSDDSTEDVVVFNYTGGDDE